ncbi:MAG TPA: glycosyltransferase [Candidatus Pacearchaeota archaeon]|nr:glycosyltransferase [Candidatus Pacearchaeota archaeon]
MKKFTSQEIKEFVSKPLFDERVILNKDPSWPKISIVTPSYNQAEFLERTILSVLNQNYPNLEYIIIDGGSTDGSVEIIKKYEKYLAYWVSEKDKGQADAINKGFAKSCGEILAYINSDDAYHPEAFFKIAKAFNKNSKADLVFGNVSYIDAYNNLIGECKFTNFDFATLIYEGGNLHQPGAFWTKKIYDKVNGFNPKYKFCMDYDFFCRVAESGNMVHIRDYLANFRHHEKSKSSTINHIGLIEHEKIARRYRKNSNKIYLKYKRMFCQMRRLFYYIAQGDVDYAVRGLAKRMRKIASKMQ